MTYLSQKKCSAKDKKGKQSTGTDFILKIILIKVYFIFLIYFSSFNYITLFIEHA
jgi:hypothetical protein